MRFRAVRADKSDGGQIVRFVEMEEAELMEGDVTVRVTHSTVNYKDALALSGKSAIPRRFPTKRSPGAPQLYALSLNESAAAKSRST